MGAVTLEAAEGCGGLGRAREVERVRDRPSGLAAEGGQEGGLFVDEAESP